MPRILVIDDQRIPRLAVAASLTEAGHEVATEDGGAAGIARARSWSPDVIVLDVNMPEMDGFAVVEQLKQDPVTAPIPVIFLTATAPTDELVVRGLDLGAYDFLSKGCSRAELLARVGVMARIKRGNDELTAIARISDTLIRTLEPADLSQLFLEQTREVFRADAGLFEFGSNDHQPSIRVGSEIDPTDPLCDSMVTTLLDWLAGMNGTHAEVVPLDELHGPAGALSRRENFQSAVATRLEYPDRPPTLLAVFTHRPNGFRRESDAPLLHLLVRQATIALDNAMLHTRTREQARKMEEQAEKLERAMTERSRFFASMSHELRTPINAVIGYNQLLQEGAYGSLTEKQGEIVGKVNRSAGHLLELINDILDISKLEAGKLEVSPERVDLAELVHDTVTSVQLQARKKGLQLEVQAPGRVPATTDPARVRQVLLNLLSNAVKFTEEGGVTVNVVPAAAGGDARQQVEWIEIRVSDTGPGIPPEDRERIFEEFEQAEGGMAQGGTGLGLAISSKLARLLGGDLLLDTEVGVGSTFSLRLPRRSGDSAADRDAA